MLRSVVYALTADNAAVLPRTHGRLMHGAFLTLIKGMSPSLATALHDNQQYKPFTVSELFPFKAQARPIQVAKGASLTWRITAYDTELAEYLTAAKPGTVIRIGNLQCHIAGVFLTPAEHPAAGCGSEEDLLAACLSVNEVAEITFHFLSPVSFRRNDQDFPWPLPSYVFGSLLDKWSLTRFPLPIAREDLAELAQNLTPRRWQGQSHVIYPKAQRGVCAFTGNFSYGLENLNREAQQLFLLLAQFAPFSGVGRLTAQGLGQTQIEFVAR
ncbi:MAG: CRISPR-associated endoribonuclease Cas6 [Selenomonadaceae bacterium]|nr:CRISPR-associated endoribonuclease Cas6 [Selenomonadaceae bacterium]